MPSKSIAIRMPATLLEAVRRNAERKGVTPSAFCRDILAFKLLGQRIGKIPTGGTEAAKEGTRRYWESKPGWSEKRQQEEAAKEKRRLRKIEIKREKAARDERRAARQARKAGGK